MGTDEAPDVPDEYSSERIPRQKKIQGRPLAKPMLCALYEWWRLDELATGPSVWSQYNATNVSSDG